MKPHQPSSGTPRTSRPCGSASVVPPLRHAVPHAGRCLLPAMCRDPASGEEAAVPMARSIGAVDGGSADRGLRSLVVSVPRRSTGSLRGAAGAPWHFCWRTLALVAGSHLVTRLLARRIVFRGGRAAPRREPRPAHRWDWNPILTIFFGTFTRAGRQSYSLPRTVSKMWTYCSCRTGGQPGSRDTDH